MQDAKTQYTKSDRKSFKPFTFPLGAILTAAVLAVGGITAYSLRQSAQTGAESNPATVVPEIKTVTALGRLDPSGEVIQVSAPSSNERLSELLVRKGDHVTKGEIIAVLDTRDRAAAELQQAKEQVRVAEANLAQVKAGAKTGEIEAQKATIARIEAERSNNIAAQEALVARREAELKNAQIEYQRHQGLFGDGAISASERDNKELTLDSAERHLEEAKANLVRISAASQEEIQEAKGTLENIAEVRPVDVDIAAAEVREAQAAVATAEAELELSYIRAPKTSQILEILTRPGEVVSTDGIVRIGQTDQLYAVAEVYESDIGKVHLGQQANITSHSLSEDLQGTVEQIGLEVERQEIINADPAANIDARTVEVRVKLNEASSKKVEGLTNLSVRVGIVL